MKIRTDFVTNSSSSSYCVSLMVQTAAKKKIKLDFYPDDEDFDGSIPLKTDASTVVSQVKNAKSVEELYNVLFDAIDISGLFEEVEDEITDEIDDDIDNMHYVDMISKVLKDDDDGDYEDYADCLKTVKRKLNKFKKQMDEIGELQEIRSVNIYENFNGWGEFARDGVSEFLSCALPEDVNAGDIEALRAAFGGKINEGAIENIADHIKSDSICQFDADIVTTILLPDGNVDKKYKFNSNT